MKLAPDATHASRATVATGSGTGTVNWRTPELQSLAKVLEGEILTTGDAVSTSRRGSPLVLPQTVFASKRANNPENWQCPLLRNAQSAIPIGGLQIFHGRLQSSRFGIDGGERRDIVGVKDSLGQRRAPGSGAAAAQYDCSHPDLVRATPPLRPIMIFGKDKSDSGGPWHEQGRSCHVFWFSLQR